MTDDRELRKLVHRAVDAYSAPARTDSLLLQRILARESRKEERPMKKKLSAAAILVIALLLASVTALAIGLSVEEMWKQSFEKMNTTGLISNLSDEAQAEITMDEAIAIAREAIIAKYGTPESELDAMGVYPTYAARGWDGMTDDYPSEWDIYFSSRTDVDLDYDHTDYGPTGEYRVFINAETKEVTYCHWYTNDFWPRAQTVWDCGSYDEVYWHYGKQTFRSIPQEQQAYWTEQLAARGYDVISEDEKLHALLLAAATELQFEPLSDIADPEDPQLAAAWAELERSCGFDAETLQKYAYVATRPDWQTGTDNICIHYSYELHWSMMESGFLDPYSDRLFNNAVSFGLYMISFAPGTTDVTAVTHVTRSEDIGHASAGTDGLLSRSDWTADDLAEFDAAYEAFDLGVKRMRAAGLDSADIEVIIGDYLHGLGGGELYEKAPADVDADKWFLPASEWDTAITAPAMSYAEFIALYGHDARFWPMEVKIALEPNRYRMPKAGETTIDEAIAMALEAVVNEHGQAALDALGAYTVNCLRVSLTGDPNEVDCRWEVYITDDPGTALNGWKVTWGEWADCADKPMVQRITDMGNG